VDAFGHRFSLTQERVVPRVVSSSERIFSRKRGNHEKENRCFLCSVQRWRSARRLALGHRAAALAVEQAERAGVLQVQVPVNSAGSSVGERGAPNAPSPNLNPSNPNTVPQSNETPVSPGTPGTSPGNSTTLIAGRF